MTSQLTHAAGADPRMVYLQACAIERDRRGSDPDHTAAGASRDTAVARPSPARNGTSQAPDTGRFCKVAHTAVSGALPLFARSSSRAAVTRSGVER